MITVENTAGRVRIFDGRLLVGSAVLTPQIEPFCAIDYTRPGYESIVRDVVVCALIAALVRDHFSQVHLSAYP